MDRKNAENIAEEIQAPPRKLQEFLSHSPWDESACIQELQRAVGETFGSPNGVLILDDTGFPKKGNHSAGVGRQYSGTLGKTDNCQVGVFLSYASLHGHTLVDRRLYILSSWFEEPYYQRREKAGIPDSLRFQTKIEQGMAMLQQATTLGHLWYQWVTGDSAYGESHNVRNLVASLGKWYCFEMKSNTHVWIKDPVWKIPTREREEGEQPRNVRGRPFSRPAPSKDSPPSVTVSELFKTLSDAEWEQIMLREGDKGPRVFDFIRVRVIESQERKPGPPAWLMIRRSVEDPSEIKYYLSNAPETISLAEMAWAGCQRWSIEVDFKLAKGEVGLDQYEITKYRGWYHHITLSLMALFFLKMVQKQWGEKKNTSNCTGDSQNIRGGITQNGMG
jgi:SRSO17 transposase